MRRPPPYVADGQVGAAIATVHHATGVRLRELPLTPDRVLTAP